MIKWQENNVHLRSRASFVWSLTKSGGRCFRGFPAVSSTISCSNGGAAGVFCRSAWAIWVGLSEKRSVTLWLAGPSWSYVVLRTELPGTWVRIARTAEQPGGLVARMSAKISAAGHDGVAQSTANHRARSSLVKRPLSLGKWHDTLTMTGIVLAHRSSPWTP